jgi:chromosome partitioning protein
VLRESYPQRLWQGVVPVDTLFREASKSGIPPAIFAPQSRGVAAYGQLLQELMREPELHRAAGMAT